MKHDLTSNFVYQLNDKLKIRNSCKKELIEKYKSSKGMSGMSSEDVNETFIFEDYDGSNIMAKNGDRIISLNRTRFEKAYPTKHSMWELNIKNKKYLLIEIDDISYHILKIEKWAQGYFLKGEASFIGHSKLNILLPKGDYKFIGKLSTILATKKICSGLSLKSNGIDLEKEYVLIEKI